jgi:Family of unknown function (DUF5677)
MFNSNSDLNTEKINDLLIHIANFVADFSQVSFSPDSFSIFLSCLRSSLAKNYEFCQFTYNDKVSPEAYFFSLSSLRGIIEDLIVLGFISKLNHESREILIASLKSIDCNESLLRQKEFFEKYRPFQEILNPRRDDSSLQRTQDRAQAIWRENGWPRFNLRKRALPPVRELAERLSPDALDLLYDFIYRLTSSTVHFSPQTLLRLGWGELDGKVTFSVKHFSDYYTKFCQVYNILLLCLYFELFEEHLPVNILFKNAISELREEILSYTRWPEMITFEEMNIKAPKQYKNNPLPYILTHYHIFEKFRQGFLLNSLQPNTSLERNEG